MTIKKTMTFLVLFAIVSGIVAVTPSAQAETVKVSTPAGTSVPGCEETNMCFVPADITIKPGDTVEWSNDDTAAHTVTGGSAADGPSGVFDSSLFMAGATFSYTFADEGTYAYFCMVHPWMVGTVIVQEAGAEEEMMADEEPMMMEEAMMSGTYLGFDIDPMLPFDNTANDMVTLSFTAKSDELMGSGAIDHLDYKVMISKDGSEVWSEQFHDHDGNLELQVTPSEGSFSTTGGDEVGSSETKAFMVKGPVFMDNGNYQITAQIVGIEFNPLSTPLTDDFTIEVVPEFGSMVMIILAVAIVGTIIVTTKTRVMLRL